ncbi:MAG: fused MFS/spermidine synthase [Candidatus Krumholzibacteriota bacterium]|nr:fused MFS/spermidine synthase [Candidatus Krumholzibacteriota bacterium]
MRKSSDKRKSSLNYNEGTMNRIFYLILSCFFLSGVAGIIYEVLWIRMIERVIGGAPFAVSIILTIFMGGLGLGSYLAGRFIDRIRDTLALVKIYGMLELVIGIYAFLIPLLLALFEPLQAALYNNLYGHFTIYNILTFIGCSVILFIPVLCMGATLPILCRFYVARLSHLGTHAGRLYGLNTIGAAAGSLATGFWLIDLWGVTGTLIFAVLINFLIGATCLSISYKAKISVGNGGREDQDPGEAEQVEGTKEERVDIQPGDSLETGSALLIFAVSGFCAMACEVIWTRLLGLIVGPTTYSFTIVLVTFITGLALGSMIFGHFADRVKKVIWLLLFTQVIAALLVLAVSQLLGNSQMLFAKLIFTFKDQFGMLSFMKAVVLFIFMIIPTLCFGATFPLVGKIYTESVSKVGKSIGFAYMINSVGALAGSFCAGFVLIPLVGKESGLGITVALQLATALVIAGVLMIRMRKNYARFAFLAVPALAGIVLSFNYPAWNHRQLSIGKYHRFEAIKADIINTGWLGALLQGPEILSKTEEGEIVYYGDGIGGFTTVVKRKNSLGEINYSMTNSGKADASTYVDMKTQTLLTHFPMLFHKDPKSVMVLGLASGITAGEVLCYPVDRLDILEISNQVVSASSFFDRWNRDVLSDPRTHLIIQDARAHLQLTNQGYDVIISEPSNPWMAGLAALFTSEFFSLAREKLNDDGILVQFIHSYQMDWETFALIGRTFAGVFPNSILVSTGPGEYAGDYLLVGFKGEERLDPRHADQKLPFIGTSENVVLSDPRLLYRLIVSENLEWLFGKGDINTETKPLLEFAAPRLMYYDDLVVPAIIERNKENSLGAGTKDIVRLVETDADSRIDFAAYLLSLFMPQRDVVDTSVLTPSQKERFFRLMEDYCVKNEIDYSIFDDEELKQRCLSIQIDLLESRPELLSDRPDPYFYRASLYHMNGRTVDAIKYYNKGLRIDPYSVVARNNLGNILLERGRETEAIDQYNAAVTLDPGHLIARNNLGNALKKQGRTDEAITQYLEVLRLDPDFVQAHVSLGEALVDRGRLDEAIGHYYEALRIDPGNAVTHNDLGIALYGRGRIDEAISHFQEAIRLRPEYSNARINLEKVLAKKRTLEGS